MCVYTYTHSTISRAVSGTPYTRNLAWDCPDKGPLSLPGDDPALTSERECLQGNPTLRLVCFQRHIDVSEVLSPKLRKRTDECIDEARLDLSWQPLKTSGTQGKVSILLVYCLIPIIQLGVKQLLDFHSTDAKSNLIRTKELSARTMPQQAVSEPGREKWSSSV